MGHNAALTVEVDTAGTNKEEMEIRLYHPKHGYHVVHSTNSLTHLQGNGWTVDDGYGKPIVKAVDENAIRDAYLLKFGKKPHHMMKIENIQKALDDNSE